MSSVQQHHKYNKPDDAAASKKKKKWAIAAIAGVAVVAAVGLGLGLGLKGSDSDANASNSNSNPSGNQDQGVVGTVDTSGSDNGSDDGEYEWTTTTEATMMVSTTEESWITTTASEEVDIVTTTTDATTTAAATEAAATTPANVVTTEAAPATTEAPAPTFWVQNYDAVIIGAGWAGIRAAKTLLSEGKTNILILEANNYIGGRSKTINSNGRPTNDPNTDTSNIPMDVGCEWLYNTGKSLGLCPNNKCRAVADTGTSLLTGPTRAVTSMLHEIGNIDCDGISSSPDITYVLSDENGKYEFVFKAHEYVSVSLYGNGCRPSMMALDIEKPRGPLYILGDVFMRKYISVYSRDGDKPQLGLALAKKL